MSNTISFSFNTSSRFCYPTELAFDSNRVAFVRLSIKLVYANYSCIIFKTRDPKQRLLYKYLSCRYSPLHERRKV